LFYWAFFETVAKSHMVHGDIDAGVSMGQILFSPLLIVWLGGVTLACQTGDCEVAGSTPGRDTAR